MVYGRWIHWPAALELLFCAHLSGFPPETWAVLMSKDEEKSATTSRGSASGAFVDCRAHLHPDVPHHIPKRAAGRRFLAGVRPGGSTIISLIGNIAASSVGYGIGNTFSSKVRKAFNEQKLKKMQRLLDRYGFGAVAIFHLCPLFPMMPSASQPVSPK
ncbi:MAG: VTT domain-containing protein [Saprospiraceae bacterium]|nr:VTT domain-containing protein [Saprospiraceae bacterium]